MKLQNTLLTGIILDDTAIAEYMSQLDLGRSFIRQTVHQTTDDLTKTQNDFHKQTQEAT